MKGFRIRISPEEWRWFFILCGVLTALGVAIALLSALFSAPEEPLYQLPRESPFRTDTVDTRPRQLLLNDFDWSVPLGSWTTREWQFNREPGEPWTAEDVARFWTSPAQFDFLQLPQRNEERIEEFFRGIP